MQETTPHFHSFVHYIFLLPQIKESMLLFLAFSPLIFTHVDIIFSLRLEYKLTSTLLFNRLCLMHLVIGKELTDLVTSQLHLMRHLYMFLW